MSNPRIKAAFQDGKAFIPFVTCGDPSLETTKKIVAELAQVGAAVIELGIPFSDPTAEGPVIRRYAFCVHDLCKRGVPLRHRKVLCSRS